MAAPETSDPEHYRVDAAATVASLPEWVIPGIEIRCAFCGRPADTPGHVYVDFASGAACMSPAPATTPPL